MKRWIAAVLIGSTAAMSLAGCAGQNPTPETDAGERYTYRDSVSNMATNWNPHTYQTADDAYPAPFLRVGLYGFVFNDALHPVEGKEPYTAYRIIPEMAASEPVDVTATVREGHPEFGIPASATHGYAYTIDLNPDACWEDGTPINADTYVWSMEQLLDPKLKNYRATDYYSGNFSIAGAEEYARGGQTERRQNSPDGKSVTYTREDLVTAPDGRYTLRDGSSVYFSLTEEFSYLGGKPLSAYKELSDLAAAADQDGYIPVNDTSWAAVASVLGEGVDPAFLMAYDYTYPTVFFDTVGLYKSGEYQITLVLDKSLSGFHLLYSLMENWIVYPPYYEACLKQNGELWTSTYNTDAATTMSYGPYKLSAYQADKVMRFEKNESWYGYRDGQHRYRDPVDGQEYSMYMTTAIECQRVEEAATRKLMFLRGELMEYGLQAEDMDTYRGSEYAYATPSETVYFLIFNGHEDAIRRREENEGFDTAKYDLQTLTLPTFRRAFAVSYDKERFAATVSPARRGGYGLIGDSYLYDPENGLRYRDTEQAKRALCAFYSVDVSRFATLDDAVRSITGYDPETARELYQQAYAEALAAGYITDNDGDGICDQILRIEYCAATVTATIEKTLDYMNDKLTEVLTDTPFAGRIRFYASAPYGNDWVSKIKSGMSDTVLAGWSGSALNPFSLSDLYVNPASAYNARWFNGAAEEMTLRVNVAPPGAAEDMRTLRMSLKDWSDALNGAEVHVDGVTYNFGEGHAELDTRLAILSAFEERILMSYDYIPMLQGGDISLLSAQVYYVVDEYNPVMGRGGIAYLKYNYSDREWKRFVDSLGGELRY